MAGTIVPSLMRKLASPMPKPVESVLVERRGAASFKIGVAAINGWRPAMEDAHVVHVKDTCGFFGVFDGHNGSECSEFLARRLQQELEDGGVPEDDEAVKALLMRLDQEFIESSRKGGSTGTFAIIEKSSQSEGQCTLRIGNVGDSRVLLGHASGLIHQGPGTDSSLTTDHTPDLPSERNRIEKTMHKVKKSQDGVARIDGQLSVSRAFGDYKFKQSPGLALQEQAVSANPDLGTFTCDASDFVVLMCDGICEGQFSNSEVISLAASHLQEHGDPGKAAAAVCKKALAENSMDNLTCMVVSLSGGELEPESEFLPGSFSAPEHEGFRNAYQRAAQAANLSIGQAVEKRHDFVTSELLGNLPSERRQELERELDSYQGGPPLHLATGSRGRSQWFEEWCKKDQNVSEAWSTTLMMNQQVKPREVTSLRKVFIPSEDVLRSAIVKHSALKWEARMSNACNSEAQVVEDDVSDGTSMVQYGAGLSMKAWLPTAVLLEV